MINLKSLIESYIRAERSESGLTVADGEAGRGIYFSLSKYPKMVDYYKTHGDRIRMVRAIPRFSAKIIDLTAPETLRALILFMRDEIDGLSSRMPGYIRPRINRENYQRFGRLITDFMRLRYPAAVGYIVGHRADGTSLPTGKQLIVTDESGFDFEDI
jgi:hypothetical protein